MNILVINAGSSSLKYQVIELPANKLRCKGMADRIGQKQGSIDFKTDSIKNEMNLEIENHQAALDHIAKWIRDPKNGILKDNQIIDVVAHRVVHGGNVFSEPTQITDQVKKEIESLFVLAPLHNPANLAGIEVTEKLFPKANQVAVFDTAFHQTMPEKAYRYAIPKELADEEHIRVYGFHGTSHKYITQKTQAFLNRKVDKLITIHLGNGCSISAVKNGQCIDTSLGFGPVNGLVMGTRSGDIDQSVIPFLAQKKNMSLTEINNLLQKQSGMLGLTGFSDLRDIEERAENGDETCQLALEINSYRIQKFIGAYAAALNGVDTIVFTAGIGENSDIIRRMVCKDMSYLGIELNESLNKIRSKEVRNLKSDKSKVNILVVPTNEELEIAEQAYRLLN